MKLLHTLFTPFRRLYVFFMKAYSPGYRHKVDMDPHTRNFLLEREKTNQQEYESHQRRHPHTGADNSEAALQQRARCYPGGPVHLTEQDRQQLRRY